MILPDTNLLLYAIDERSRHHAAAFAWWKDVLEGQEPIVLCEPVVSALIRLSTNPRIVAQALTIEEAYAHLDNWLSFPGVRYLPSGPEQYADVRQLLLATGLGGNLVTDAHIAALALRHRAVIYTADTDFARFPEVKARNPLSPKKA